jgi:hypothetical protein
LLVGILQPDYAEKSTVIPNRGKAAEEEGGAWKVWMSEHH